MSAEHNMANLLAEKTFKAAHSKPLILCVFHRV